MQILRILTALVLFAGPAFDACGEEVSWSRWGKSKLRWLVTGSEEGADARFGIRTDSDWRTAPAESTRVVLVHGFNAAPDSMLPFAEALRAQGHPCALACYPNDQAIDRSANRLARELRPVVQRAGGARVAVVTHSMGGLVARRVLEDPRLDPGVVDRLILIAPPNHGSTLARISIGTDLYEHALLPADEAEASRRKTGFYHSIDDGMGEATHDLRPGSPFLVSLNARSRNPRVAYTIVLGDRGRFSDAQLERVRSALEAAAKKPGVTSWFAPNASRCLAACDEVFAGRGDGAVALSRGRLAGVEDVHVLPGTHDMINLRGEAAEQLVAIVRERL